MKKILISIILSSFFIMTGCSSLEWRDIYSETNSENLKIQQLSPYSDEEGRKSASFDLVFNSSDYVYPYKLEKFYHVLYMLDVSNVSPIKDVHSIYPITKKETHYEMIVEFKEKNSIMDVINHIYKRVDRKHDINLQSDIDDNHWGHINNKNTNMYKLIVSSNPTKRAIHIMIQEFDGINDSIENY